MIMKKHIILDILLWCLKIILPILILTVLVFVSYRLVEGHLDDLANRGTEGYHSGMGLYLFASHVLLLAANAVLTLVGIIGLVIAKLYKGASKHRKNVITFIYLSLAPLCSQCLYVLINFIVLNIG